MFLRKTKLKSTFEKRNCMPIRCNFSDISYLSETQKNNFQFLDVATLSFLYGQNRYSIMYYVLKGFKDLYFQILFVMCGCRGALSPDPPEQSQKL